MSLVSSNSRSASRGQGSSRRRLQSMDMEKSAGSHDVGGTSNQRHVVDLKDDDDEVQIISPVSVVQGKALRRNKRSAAAATSHPLDLELTLGSSASTSQKASVRVSRGAVIDLTSGKDDDVVLLASVKRKATQLPLEQPSKEIQLTCSICMDVMKEETSTVCGHIFCRSCILGAIKTQKKCPSCRRKLTNSNIHRIYLSSGTR